MRFSMALPGTVSPTKIVATERRFEPACGKTGVAGKILQP